MPESQIERATTVSRICHEMMEDYLTGKPVLGHLNQWGLCREIADRQAAWDHTYPDLYKMVTTDGAYLGPGGIFNEARFDALCWLCALSPQDLIDIGVVRP